VPCGYRYVRCDTNNKEWLRFPALQFFLIWMGCFAIRRGKLTASGGNGPRAGVSTAMR